MNSLREKKREGGGNGGGRDCGRDVTRGFQRGANAPGGVEMIRWDIYLELVVGGGSTGRVGSQGGGRN